MDPSIDILLATYQGSLFLDEQIQSILNQTYSDLLHIWIRDDGSTDSTLQIIQKWIQKYPDKITLLSITKRLGPKGNFAELMQGSRAPYVMFADQDDQWHAHKVEISLKRMQNLENQQGSHTPLLIHTDLAVVDQHLSPISSSFWKYSGLNPNQMTLNYLITQNILTGCTFLMNRSLVNLALPIPDEAIMHDWWIGLVASCFGKIEYIPESTLLYRQHQSNDVGARAYGLRNYFTRPRRATLSPVNATFNQAQKFLTHYATQLTSSQQMLLKSYATLHQQSFLKQKKRNP